MLNRSQLLHQLEQFSSELFIDYSHEYESANTLWKIVAQDPLFIHKIRSSSSSIPVPSWQGKLDEVIAISSPTSSYRVFSIDGSQIYPDKHQGTHCFLINIGLIELLYGGDITRKPFICSSKPHLFLEEQDDESLPLTVDLVNCRRQEYELRAALECAQMITQQKYPETALILFDGSLIFWHLDSYDVQLKQKFLSYYLLLLHQLYEQQVLMASYISLPKSKEWVQLLRLAINEQLVPSYDAPLSLDHVVDSSIAYSFLTAYTRSIVFKNNSSISKYYPDHLHPHFFYMHVGDEIGRVEIPAWIAEDEDKVNQVASLILDQSIKGRGYPVALAEAHEQAVIKGPDRDFFYHLIYKFGFERKKQFRLSQKSIKKRGIGI